MDELVSIIIPVYNAAETLAHGVESLIAGKYLNIEIILIDDCSTDESYQIALALQEKYRQVLCAKNEKNMGVSATRNRG